MSDKHHISLLFVLRVHWIADPFRSTKTEQYTCYSNWLKHALIILFDKVVPVIGNLLY